MIITLIVFILILGLLVFVHEFGHFWMAKRSGVQVHEFAFGFRPRLFAWKRGETEYAINLLPFGGYVRLEGEGQNTGKRSFVAQPPLVKVKVLAAGVVMNLVLGWLLLIFAYGIGSYPLTETFNQHSGIPVSHPSVVMVSPNSPADTAGLKAGDKILSINKQPITGVEQVSQVTHANAGKEIIIQFERNGQTQQVSATPRLNPPAGEGSLGIGTNQEGLVKVSWAKAPLIALEEEGSQIKAAFAGFGRFIAQLVEKRQVSQEVSGIVGIGAATGVVRRLGIGTLVQFIALISTNLAVINILPLLPLDGGHIFFVIVEAIRKKPVSDTVKQNTALAGLVFILFLFVIVTYKDLINFDIINRLRSIL
jgi:regulator of sigma E protease